MCTSAQTPIEVVCGVILEDRRVLLSKRPRGAHLAGSWEFPGGKRDPGENPEDALGRELVEETGLRFQRAVLLHREEHEYAERAVRLCFFLCLGVQGVPVPREGQELRWVRVEELRSLEVPAANRRLLDLLADQVR